MNPVSLADYRQQIEDAIDSGRYEEAIAHSRQLLKHYPKDVQGYWLLGKAMLESGQTDSAADMLERVLSADPEHMLAWVGMSEIARQRNDLESAVWYMQRAFELASDNEAVANELRRLQGRLEGTEPERIQLSEGALARLYLRGDLLTRAVAELRRLIEEYPDRLDLKVALVEALWRKGHRVQTSEVCQEILDEQPYNIKANLILGKIWSESGRDAESKPYLAQAEALDPENAMAQELFGSASPLPPAEPQIIPLAYEEETSEGDVDSTKELEGERVAPSAEELPVEKAGVADLPGELRDEPAATTGADQAAEGGAPGVPADTPEVEEPREKVEEPTSEEESVSLEAVDDESFEWLRKLATEERGSQIEEGDQPEEIPAWLSELEGQEDVELDLDELEVSAENVEGTEIPAWLQDLIPAETEQAETVPPEDEAEPSEEQVAAEQRAAEEALEELEKAAGTPSWFEPEKLPPAEEALNWLAQLAEVEGESLAPESAEPEISAAEPPPVPEEADEPPMEAEAPEEPELVSAESEDMSLSRETTREQEEEVTTAPAEAASEAEDVSAPLEELVAPALGQAAPGPSAIDREGIHPEPEGETLSAEPPAPTVAAEVAAGNAAAEAASVRDLDQFIANQQAYVSEHPEDLEAKLELGRVLWQADKRDDALKTYEKLIEKGRLLNEIIPDLEDYEEQQPDPRLMQALGDAYMKVDRLQEALDTYRRAMEKL